MEKNIKFNSKYNTDEEKVKEGIKISPSDTNYFKLYRKFWNSHISEDKKQELKNYLKKYENEHKNYRSGDCEICNKYYSNLYQHYYTKKHKNNTSLNRTDILKLL